MSLLSNLRAILTLGRGVAGTLPPLAEAPDPFDLFREWMAAAEAAGIFLPEAITVATASPDGTPSARMMLLKGVDDRGFRFFTNYESRKADELNANPRAAIVCHWAVLERQVRIEGAIERLTADESFAYFSTRPRGARIGAWASQQSRPLADRAELERRIADREREFADGDVPLPPYWGGFRLVPARIEFWQGRVNRLHDRLRYDRANEGWSVVRLYP
jgi:pyridoxamine 5'-phosphate oxidase